MQALIVEAKPERAGEISQVLAEAGFSTVIVADEEAALRKIADRPPDLCVVGARSAIDESIGLCRRIRQLEPPSQLPIICLAPPSDDPDALQRLDAEAGVDLALPDTITGAQLAAHAHRLAADAIRNTAIWYAAPGEGDSDEIAETSGANTVAVAVLALTDAVSAGQCQTWLEESGFEVLRCANMDSLRATLERTGRCMVLVSDPFDGYEAVDVVRWSSSRSPAPIFLLLSYATEANARQATERGGFSDYLLSPLVREEVVGRFRRAAEG